MNSWTIRLSIVLALVLCSCATTPETVSEQKALDGEARSELVRMIGRDDNIQKAVDHAHAYAVFPDVGKGGVIVGGAFGRGVVYQKDHAIGYCSVTQGSLGGQIGGRTYAELILFQSQTALDRFKHKDASLGVEATAIAITEGSSAQLQYHDGVAVFVQQKLGLMADASVSGQTFDYEPMATEPGKDKRTLASTSE